MQVFTKYPTLVPPLITESDKCYMKSRIFKALQQCAKVAESLQRDIIHFGVIVFLFKSLNVFNLLAATKNLRTNFILLLLNQHIFSNLRNKKVLKLFVIDFDYIR